MPAAFDLGGDTAVSVMQPFSSRRHVPYAITLRFTSGQSKENLYIETEKRGFLKYFVARGTCARPVYSAISEEEGFQFGTCTVGKENTATYAITNHGLFDLIINVKSDIPLTPAKNKIVIKGQDTHIVVIKYLQTTITLQNTFVTFDTMLEDIESKLGAAVTLNLKFFQLS